MRLELKEITFSYAGAPSHLFDSLSLVIQGPGFFSLFGLSGCGKSTLSHIISGMTPPDSGEVTGDGGIVLYAHAGERFPAWVSIGDHLRRVSPPQDFHMLRSLMELMGLTEVEDHRFPDLSMGQKNRANLLRYLMQRFDLLVMDEVLANVDEPSRERIISALKERFPDRTFLYVSHNVSEVAFFSRSIWVFPAGEGPVTGLVEIGGMDGRGSAASAGGDVAALGHRIVAACTGVER